MPPSPRVVIDPNVLVSAAITPSGTTAAVIDLIDAGVVVLIASPLLLAELAGVLGRDRFRQYLSLEAVEAYVAELTRRADPWDDPSDRPAVSPDPDDDYLIALARASGADALVSGDNDLTQLDLPDILILKPRQLLESVATPPGEEKPPR